MTGTGGGFLIFAVRRLFFGDYQLWRLVRHNVKSRSPSKLRRSDDYSSIMDVGFQRCWCNNNSVGMTCEYEVGGGEGVSRSNPLHRAIFVGTG